MSERGITQEELHAELDKIAEESGMPRLPPAPPIPEGMTALEYEQSLIRASLDGAKPLEGAIESGVVVPLRRNHGDEGCE